MDAAFSCYESLMGRNYDEPFSLYGLLAETINVADDGSWVEFQLRPEARFFRRLSGYARRRPVVL